LLWPFLFGVFDPDSTHEERDMELRRLRNAYAKLVFVCDELDAEIESVRRNRDCSVSAGEEVSGNGMVGMLSHDATRMTTPRLRYGVTKDMVPSSTESSPEKDLRNPAAVNGSCPSPRLTGNYASFADTHRIIVMDAVRTDMKGIFDVLNESSSGVGNRSRSYDAGMSQVASRGQGVPILPISVCEGLPELMLVDPPQPKPYHAVAAGDQPIWRSALATQMIDGSKHLTSLCRTLMIRLVNILSAYAVHDPECGYCQGMSDLAAVFVALEDEDALAFACFEKFMRTVRQNFMLDESGIKNQLATLSRILEDTDRQLYNSLVCAGAEDCMFAYRMVVVLMRRELPLLEVMVLWEVSWSFIMDDEEEISYLGSKSMSLRTISLATSNSGGLHPVDITPQSNKQDAAQEPVSSRQSSNSLKQGRWRGNVIKQQRQPPGFLLHFIATCIRAHRSTIIEKCKDPDDILRYFSSFQIKFSEVLSKARKQHKTYHQGLQVIQSLQS
jgi:hypothetical protein